MRRSADLPRRHCQQASSDDAEGAAMQRADAQTSQPAGAIGWRTGCRRARHDDENGGTGRRWLCADQVCVVNQARSKRTRHLWPARRHGDLQGQVTTATAVTTAAAVGEDSGLMGISTMQRGTRKSTTCQRMPRPSSAWTGICRWRFVPARTSASSSRKLPSQAQPAEFRCWLRSSVLLHQQFSSWGSRRHR
jgi:hypothetical protein